MTSSVDLLVVAAMADEARAVSALCSSLTTVDTPFVGGGTGEGASASGSVSAATGEITAADGTSRSIALVTTGIGTAAASAVASWAIAALGPRGMVSVGTCGGLAADISVGTVVVGTRYAYSIAEARAFGYVVGQVPGAPVTFSSAQGDEIAGRIRDAGIDARAGQMISGDAFVTADVAAPMREKFPSALSADMETTALAHTAHLLGVPFWAIRAVSDLCSPAADQEFHLGLDIAADRSARGLQQTLLLLPSA